jgi:single cache domain-containing protein
MRGVTILPAAALAAVAAQTDSAADRATKDEAIAWYLLAHGTNEKLIGQNLIEAKDPDGKLFVKEPTEMAKAQDDFWQDYKFIRSADQERRAEADGFPAAQRNRGLRRNLRTGGSALQAGGKS